MVVTLIAALAVLLMPALSSVEGPVLSSIEGPALRSVEAQQPETMSLLGQPLHAPPMSREARSKADAELVAARAAFTKDPSNADAALALARADLALGHVGEALEHLTRGIEAKPEDARLYLERGLGFIVIRKFPVAEKDFSKVAETLPAAYCGLGLAQYLAADFTHARESYANCAEPGIFAYLADRRTGKSTMPRPTVSPDQASSTTEDIKLPGSVSSKSATSRAPMAERYMDAVDDLMAGKTDAAKDRLKEIVERHRNGWMNPVYIAAEADYARILKAKGRRR
jgi:tetratricopeptide (TPR) repeat protein